MPSTSSESKNSTAKQHFRNGVNALSAGQIIAKVQRVQEAIKKYKQNPEGIEPINAVVGVLKIKDSNGAKKTWIPQVVIDAHKKVAEKPSNIFDYGTAFADPDLAEQAAKFFIGEQNINKLKEYGYFTSTSISAGGTAGLSHVLNIFNKGYPWVLAANAWGGYKKIREHLAGFLPSLNTFEIIDELGKLNVDDFGACLERLMHEENGAIVILNLPYDNPTGLQFSNAEMTELAKKINLYIEEGKEITLVLDTAYDKFGFDENSTLDSPLEFLHDFLGAINDKAGNKFKVVIVPSFSKNHAAYGLRMAFPTVITRSQELAAVFPDYIASAARGSYSSASNGSINTAKVILKDESARKEVESYNKEASKLLSERLQGLIKTFEKLAGEHQQEYQCEFIKKQNADNLYELKKAGETLFELVVPSGGFFATLKAKDLQQANKFNEYLEKEMRLFMTNFDKYVRLPICSMTDQEEMDIIVGRIYKAVQEVY